MENPFVELLSIVKNMKNPPKENHLFKLVLRIYRDPFEDCEGSGFSVYFCG